MCIGASLSFDGWWRKVAQDWDAFVGVCMHESSGSLPLHTKTFPSQCHASPPRYDWTPPIMATKVPALDSLHGTLVVCIAFPGGHRPYRRESNVLSVCQDAGTVSGQHRSGRPLSVGMLESSRVQILLLLGQGRGGCG